LISEEKFLRFNVGVVGNRGLTTCYPLFSCLIEGFGMKRASLRCLRLAIERVRSRRNIWGVEKKLKKNEKKSEKNKGIYNKV
jgi:hypothetical protein